MLISTLDTNSRGDKGYNPIAEKMRWLLADSGTTKVNMFTGLHSVTWHELVEVPDRRYFEHVCRKHLIENFCNTVAKRFIVTTQDESDRKTWKCQGFIFNEQELIDILAAAYMVGRETHSIPALGGLIRDTREEKEALISAMALCAAQSRAERNEDE